MTPKSIQKFLRILKYANINNQYKDQLYKEMVINKTLQYYSNPMDFFKSCRATMNDELNYVQYKLHPKINLQKARQLITKLYI